MKFSTPLIVAIAAAIAEAVVVTDVVHVSKTVTVFPGAPSSNVVQAAAQPSSSSQAPPPPPPAQSVVVSSSSAAPQPTTLSTQFAPSSAAAAPSSDAPSSSSAAASPSAAPSGSSSTSGGSSFADSMVADHNKYRSQHDAGPVSWNDTMADFALNYLQSHNSASSDGGCAIGHSGGPYGENLAYGANDADAAVQMWYNEGQGYNYDTSTFSESAGHFTQVIWKDTTQIGCAQIQCANDQPVIICEYYPRGNMAGSYLANVLQ